MRVTALVQTSLLAGLTVACAEAAAQTPDVDARARQATHRRHRVGLDGGTHRAARDGAEY